MTEAIISAVPILFVLAGCAILVQTIRETRVDADSTAPANEDGPTNDEGPSRPERTIVPCKGCGKKLRLPATAGMLKVTCPSCGHSFGYAGGHHPR